MSDTLNDLARQLARFAQERDWQQFHAPKNLACALIVEAGELLEHFQWLPEPDSHHLPPAQAQAVADEIADVLLYLVRLADVMGIDPVAAAQCKLARNALRYPADSVRGSARKAADS